MNATAEFALKSWLDILDSHLLHGGLVKLVQIKAVDSFLSPEKQILIWNDKRENNPDLFKKQNKPNQNTTR